MMKSVFLLGIMMSLLVFTPFAFGQDLQKATWLENASVVYDQIVSKSVIASITFQTSSNTEIQFSDQLLEKISSYPEIRNVFFTNKDECVMGIASGKQCIMINFDINALKGTEGGINTVQANGKIMGDKVISELNDAFGINTKFHSVYIQSLTAENPMAAESATSGTVTATYTMPKQDTRVLFSNLSERLIHQYLIDSQGYFPVAKQLANDQDSEISIGIVMGEDKTLYVFKVSREYEGASDEITRINPLGYFGIDKLERSKYFEAYFVPLNSIVQVVILPESPSKIESLNTNILQRLDSVRDVSQNGWFFVSDSHDKIDARYIFGTTTTVTGDELVMELGSRDMNDENITENNMPLDNENDSQYVILAVIVIAAIGAALFYLKGYKRNH